MSSCDAEVIQDVRPRCERCRGRCVSPGCGLRPARVFPVIGDIDTWLGCIVSPRDAAAEVERLGFVDVALLPDDIHARQMGYSLLGRLPRSVAPKISTDGRIDGTD